MAEQRESVENSSWKKTEEAERIGHKHTTTATVVCVCVCVCVCRFGGSLWAFPSKMPRRKPTTKGIFKGLLSEFLGSLTFTFVTVAAVGTAHLISSASWLPARLLVDAVVHGLTYGFCIYLTVYQTWECHFFNPAIATALALTESSSNGTRWPLKKHAVLAKTFALIGAQLFGTLLGVCLVFLVIPDSVGNREVLGAPRLRFGSTFGSGFLLEALGAFFLTLLVLVSAAFHQPLTRASSIAVSIGLANTALQLFLFPFTSACLNPTRALALFVCSWSFSLESLLFLTAPFVGSLLATLFFIGVFTSSTINARDSSAGVVFSNDANSGFDGAVPVEPQAFDSNNLQYRHPPQQQQDPSKEQVYKQYYT